jgi:hypothetical protein
MNRDSGVGGGRGACVEPHPAAIGLGGGGGAPALLTVHQMTKFIF